MASECRTGALANRSGRDRIITGLVQLANGIRNPPQHRELRRIRHNLTSLNMQLENLRWFQSKQGGVANINILTLLIFGGHLTLEVRVILTHYNR